MIGQVPRWSCANGFMAVAGCCRAWSRGGRQKLRFWVSRFDINQIYEFIRCDEHFPASPPKLPTMHSFIPPAIRRNRNQRRLTLENVSGIAGMSVQHLSEIESSKRDPRLSSIERIADAMELAVMLVPEHMAPDIRRYIASQGRVFTTTQSTKETSHDDSVYFFGT